MQRRQGRRRYYSIVVFAQALKCSLERVQSQTLSRFSGGALCAFCTQVFARGWI